MSEPPYGDSVRPRALELERLDGHVQLVLHGWGVLAFYAFMLLAGVFFVWCCWDVWNAPPPRPEPAVEWIT